LIHPIQLTTLFFESYRNNFLKTKGTQQDDSKTFGESHWIVGMGGSLDSNCENNICSSPPLTKRTAPNGAISKSRSIEQPSALVLVVLSPFFPFVPLQPRVDSVGGFVSKGGFVLIFCFERVRRQNYMRPKKANFTSVQERVMEALKTTNEISKHGL
jgi:hypothetical protein